MIDSKVQYYLIQIIMFFQKIGKDRHKFKSYIKFIKVKNKATAPGKRFRVKVQRGSHSIQASSHECKKGYAKFLQQQQHIIPLTLFYDADEKDLEYLQKIAEIKLYEFSSDQTEPHYVKIGHKEIDMAKYALQSSERQINLQLEPQHQDDEPVLRIMIKMQRQDDDSKSVQTYSSKDSKDGERGLIERMKDKTKRSKEKYISNNKHKEEVQSSSHSKNKIKVKDIQRKNMQLDHTPVKRQNRDEQKSPLIPKPPKNESTKLNQPILNQPPKQIVQQQLIKKEQKSSAELQVFLLQKSLKDKEAQISQLKYKSQQQQRAIDRLVQQASAPRNKQTLSYAKEMQSYKNQMISKDMKIDELETKIKSMTAREKQYEQTIIQQKKDFTEMRQKMSSLKYRLAYMMQECFMMGNQVTIQLMGKYLSQQ